MKPSESSPYRQLLKRTRGISFLNRSATVLNWHLETYLPSKAVPFRAEQLAYLRGRRSSS